MRVIWWGTYDSSVARTKILMEGLAAASVEIVEIHFPVWEEVRDKSLMTRGTMLRRFLRWVLAYPRLVARYLAAPDHDVVVVSYLGHVDVLVLSPFAWLRGKPIIWDAFISLYNTLVEDRKLVKPAHP